MHIQDFQTKTCEETSPGSLNPLYQCILCIQIPNNPVLLYSYNE